MLFLVEYCDTIKPILDFVKVIINLIKFAVPIVIIVLGSLDLFKAVVASKEDEIKAAQKLLIKRIIYGIVIFFLVTIIQLVFTTLAGSSNIKEATSWIDCWNAK